VCSGRPQLVAVGSKPDVAEVDVLARFERLLHKVLIGLLLAMVALLIILVAGAIAYDNHRQVWDVQTFALLVGGGGYFVAQIGGMPRPGSVEIGFIASAAAAAYASLTQLGTQDLLVTLAGAAGVALLAVMFRKLASPYADPSQPNEVRGGDSAVSSDDGVLSKDIEPMDRAVGARRVWILALVAGAIGGLVARFAHRAR
jgi:hypothetical protein